MEIIEQLVSQLGVTNEQAEGGVGALFKMAQEKLGDGDFSQVVGDLIPGPRRPDRQSAGSRRRVKAAGGGLMGALGGVAEAVGMGDAAEKLGDLSSLSAVFESPGPRRRQ